MEWPRKVTVYGSKWPSDEDYDRSLKYFRKYVKVRAWCSSLQALRADRMFLCLQPVLVAAAIDYEMINGKRHGDLTDRVASTVKAQRRIAAGLDQPKHFPMPIPTQRTPEEERRAELEGGIVIVGRQTFKEFMAGLKRGWTQTLEKVDSEDELARELQDDGAFDELEEPTQNNAENLAEKSSPLLSHKISPIYSPLQNIRPKRPPPREASAISPAVNAVPGVIPPQPPILFVSFTNYIGFTQIPLMIWEFFNQRYKVRAGAEAGYRLVMKCTRPFIGPSAIASNPSDQDEASRDYTPPIDEGDLAFDRPAEGYYKSSLSKTIPEIEKARKKYYEELPNRLKATRDLARGIRAPTKDETNYPPPSEVELRAERLKKELRWRNDLEGWEIVRPDAPVTWDERFRDALSVFVDPPPGTETPSTSQP
jgi:mitochondrial import inner membrane translocase subunit TIM54